MVIHIELINKFYSELYIRSDPLNIEVEIKPELVPSLDEF